MIQLLIAGMNRTQYLDQVTESWATHHPDLYANHFQFHDTDGLGMAQAVNTAWQQALTYDWDYLLHAEEDMLLLRPLNLVRAVSIMERHYDGPRIAQMLFQREPWWGSQPEMESGSVMGGIKATASYFHQHRSWAEQNTIFSLNPCLIPRHIVELGWPVGNEAGMTQQLLDKGYVFGVWGSERTRPYIRHIGHERGEGWKL